MKTNIKYLWKTFNKEIDCAVESVNSAQDYLDEPKKRRWTPVICFGPRSVTTKELIARICKAPNYPPIPFFADNKELREQNKPREKSPLFRVAASAISFKYENLKKQLSAAIQEENSKVFVANSELPLRIESTSDILPEEKEPAETLDTKGLSDKL